MPADDAQMSHGLAPGSEVQGYRILRAIGAGGFGITYLAEHIAIGNRVAVKEFLPAGIAARSPDGLTVRPVSHSSRQDYAWGLERFRQEARTLGALDHANIVRVLNFVEANGTAYMVMDFVDGESLGARLERRRTLPPAEVEALLPGLLAGLEAVHSAGLLHRDIKPDNVIVRPSGVPVLIDFGAARQALGAHSRSLTTVLSEGYAPYEQYDPHGNQGPWTDIYALGGLLYRCVTGERPVPAPRRIDARVKHKPDPLPSAAGRAQGRHAAGLLAAIDAALGAVETERPQDMAEFRALLAEPDPVSAPPDIAEPRSSRATGATLIAGRAAPARRAATPSRSPGAPLATRRGMRGALIGGLLVLVAGGAAAGYVVISERNTLERQKTEEAAAAQRKAEEEARVRREQEEARRKQQADDARRKAEQEEAKRKAEQEETRRKADEEERKRREAEDERKKSEEAAAKQALEDVTEGLAALRRSDFDGAIRAFTRAIDSKKLPAWRLPTAYGARGSAWRGKGDSARSLADLDEAIRLDPKLHPAYHSRALVRLDAREHDRALADVDQAVRLKPEEGAYHNTRGIILYGKRDWDGAISAYTESLRLRPNNVATHFNRGLAWQMKGDRAQAIADYRESLRIDPNYQRAREELRRLGANP